MEVDFSEQIKKFKKESIDSSMNSAEASEILSIIIDRKVGEHNNEHENKVSSQQLKNVYLRGSDSYNLTHRVGKTKAQWAMARVNMFLKMNRGGNVPERYLDLDKDILLEDIKALSDNDFFDFSDLDLNLASLDLIKAGIEKWNQDFDCEELFYSEAETKVLNKPFIFENNSEKYGVYLKNPDNGKNILVEFEKRRVRASLVDLEVTDPMYWSAKFWTKKAISGSISSDAIEWDDEEVVTQWHWDESKFKKEAEIADSVEDLDIDLVPEKENI